MASLRSLKTETLEDVQSLLQSIEKEDYENAIRNVKAIKHSIEYLLLGEETQSY